MTPIISGTTRERIVRAFLVTALVCVFAVLYLWDGYVGYQRRNALEFAKLLGMPSEAPPIHHDLSSAEGRKLADGLKPGHELSEVIERLGLPSVRQPDAAYYLAPGGWLKLSLRGARVQEATWFKAGHSESDQQLQRWIGYALFLAGIGVTFHFVRVLNTRTVLSDAGLQIAGQALLSFGAMTELRKPASGRPGVVELAFKRNGGVGVVLLDDYIIREFPALVAAICERKGFENPLKN